MKGWKLCPDCDGEGCDRCIEGSVPDMMQPETMQAAMAPRGSEDLGGWSPPWTDTLPELVPAPRRRGGYDG